MDISASLWTEASRDLEAEGRERVHTAVSQDATSQCWPFLAMAKSESEFGHRLAMIEDRLLTIASEHGVSYEEVTAPLVNGFKAVLAAREAGSNPKVASANCSACGGPVVLTIQPGGSGTGPGRSWRMGDPGGRQVSQCKDCGNTEDHPRKTASAVECKNCNHSNPGHRRGGICDACGCQSYQPGAHQVGASKTASEDDGVRFQCPDCQGMGLSFDVLGKGLTHCGTCDDSGAVFRQRKDDSTGGYSRGDFHFTPAPKTSAKFDDRLATLKQALEEGQDPLSWLADNSAPATPTHHDSTEQFEGSPETALDAVAAKEPDPFV